MNAHLTVDGQRQARPQPLEPLPLRLRDPLALPPRDDLPEVKERGDSGWLEFNGWVETERSAL